MKAHSITHSIFLLVILMSLPLFSIAEEGYQFTTDWTSSYTDDWKRELAQLSGKSNLRYLEIGIWEGRTMIWMFKNILTHKTSKATALDIKIISRLKHNLLVAKINKRVHLLESSSAEALKKMKPESFDIIYLDACHLAKNVYIDSALAWDLLKPGGLLLFDDYKFYDNGKLPLALRPKHSIDAFLSANRDDLTLLHHDYQVIVKKNEIPLNSLCPDRCNQCSRFFEYIYSWNIFKQFYEEGCIKKGLYTEIPGSSKLYEKAISTEEDTDIRAALLLNRSVSSKQDKIEIIGRYPQLKNLLSKE